jgi:hypothetical protein
MLSSGISKYAQMLTYDSRKAEYVISQLFTKTFSLNLKPGLTDWQKLSKLKTTV